MSQRRKNCPGGLGPERVEVVLSLTLRHLHRNDLADCEWSGGPLHLAAVARELERADAGEVDYLALCVPSGVPVAIGGVDFIPFADAGYLWQLAVHPLLQRCGIGTLRDDLRADAARPAPAGLVVDVCPGVLIDPTSTLTRRVEQGWRIGPLETLMISQEMRRRGAPFPG